MQRILVLGGGFAGLWAALGAARKLDEMGVGPDRAEVVLVERNPFHNIWVRNYEADLEPVTVPLAEVLDPAGIRHLQGEVTGIDTAGRRIALRGQSGPETLGWDRLVFALGSHLHLPDLPGAREHGFDVDSHAGACRLAAHLADLARGPPSPARDTVVVAGAGFTGLETAAEMPGRLSRLLGRAGRVVLLEAGAQLGATMGEDARPAIAEALAALSVEVRTGTRLAELGPDRAVLDDGSVIPTATTILCAGMRANPLTAELPVPRDRLGRVEVDDRMRVLGLSDLFAAGDCAWFLIDGANPTVMSCQHGRPMGRFAGHNAAADLFGAPLLPLRIDWYVTVLDLGPCGALYTAGRERRLIASGTAAKRTKQIINQQRIYPPRGGDRAALFAAAAPIVQAPPPELAGPGAETA